MIGGVNIEATKENMEKIPKSEQEMLYKKSNYFYNTFDKTFKRIMNLSSRAVVNLINGLYGKDYDVNSKVTYLSTEGVSDNYKDMRSDVMIKIENGDIYHMEAQMYKDENIVFRVFGYGYMNALQSKEENTLKFPEPKIIYLYSENDDIPKELELKLDFGSQGEFIYKVGTFDYIRTSVDEINNKKLVLLIPFQLLRLRKKLSKKRDESTIDELKRILINDILESIKVNLECGNIESGDAYRLKECTVILYHYLYSKYAEMESGGVNSMVDDMLELEVDKVIDEVTRKVTAEVTESNIRSMVEILCNAGFSKKEITDMITGKFRVDVAYVEQLFN